MDIQTLRREMDAVNRQIADLFLQRMELSARIGELKNAQQLPVLDASREEEILCEMTALAEPELKESMRVLFQTLFELSRSYQQKLQSTDSKCTKQRIKGE